MKNLLRDHLRPHVFGALLQRAIRDVDQEFPQLGRPPKYVAVNYSADELPLLFCTQKAGFNHLLTEFECHRIMPPKTARYVLPSYFGGRDSRVRQIPFTVK